VIEVCDGARNVTWLAALTSVTAAALWITSTTVSVLSPDTKGWGALVGGMVVVPGISGERLDLVGTLRKQWLWNRRAASATAVAAVLTAIALLI
jgi:hypothetical protein